MTYAGALVRFPGIGDIIRWVFGTATVLTNKGKAIFADRVRTTPATYTTAPKFIAMGTGATGAARTAVAADTALSTEVETRTSGTESVVTTTQTGDDPSIKNPMFTDAERTGGTVAGHCPLLRRDGDRFRCAGYGHHAFYLNGCVSFPSRPEDMVLVPSCSYRWERA
jgi:hypothetical protein